PADQFPIVIDPTMQPTLNASSLASFNNLGQTLGGVARTGNDVTGGTGTWRAAAYLPLPNLGSTSCNQPWHLELADLTLPASKLGSTFVDLYGEPLSPASFSAVLGNAAQPALGHLTSTVSFADVTNWVGQHGAGW